jgi:hypothetical protein
METSFSSETSDDFQWTIGRYITVFFITIAVRISNCWHFVPDTKETVEIILQNQWAAGHCPLSGIINTRIHNVLETGSVMFIVIRIRIRIPDDGQVHKPSDSECYTPSSEPVIFYYYKTMFQDKFLRLSRPKRKEKQVGGGKCIMRSLIIRIRQLIWLRWTEYMASKGEVRHSYVFVGKPEGKRPGRPRHWQKDNIKMDFK